MRFPITLPGAARPFDLVALGENSLDFVALESDGPAAAGKRRLRGFAIHSGGQTATAAVAAAKLGIRVRYVGAFGGDEWGGRAKNALVLAGVDVRPIERPEAPGRVAVILVDPSGDRTVLEHRDPRLEILPAELDAAGLTDGRLLLVDATSLPAAVSAARMARTAGTPTLVDVDTADPAVADLLSAVDFIIVPESFVSVWTGESALGEGLSAMAAQFPAAAAIIATCGPDGSIARVSGQQIHTRGYAVDVVDTTGAGDAFRAGLAAGLIRLGDDTDAGRLLAFANATAALNCRQTGAQTGLPSWAEVEALVTAGPDGRSK